MRTLLDKFLKLKILVIGDIILDHYIFGDVTRISPEAPVPVVEISSERNALGGAANVALNLRAVGIAVEILGVFGQDHEGKKISSLMSENHIFWNPICEKKGLRSIQKSRVVVRNQQLCRLDIEDDPKDYTIPNEMVLRAVEAKIDHYDAIILSDYAKGFLNQQIVDQITELAHRHGVFVAADPKPKSGVHYKDVDLFKPNQTEALELLHKNNLKSQCFNDEEISRELLLKFRPKYLVVTLGKNGMLICEKGHSPKRVSQMQHEVFDVSGAGDTAMAFLTAALVSGENILSAAELASMAAGIVVTKMGTATISREELLSLKK